MKALVAMVGACVLLAGCAGWSRWDKDFEAAPEPTRTDWTLTKQRCSGCHSLEKVFLNLNTTLKDRGDILFAVEDMADRPGSGIRNEEIARIADTLEWYRANE